CRYLGVIKLDAKEGAVREVRKTRGTPLAFIPACAQSSARMSPCGTSPTSHPCGGGQLAEDKPTRSFGVRDAAPDPFLTTDGAGVTCPLTAKTTDPEPRPTSSSSIASPIRSFLSCAVARRYCGSAM